MTEMSQDGAVVCVTLLFAGRYQRRWSVMPVGDEVPFLAAGRPSRAGQQLPAMRNQRHRAMAGSWPLEIPWCGLENRKGSARAWPNEAAMPDRATTRRDLRAYIS